MMTGVWYSHQLTERQKQCLLPNLKLFAEKNPFINIEYFACSFTTYNEKYHQCYCFRHITSAPIATSPQLSTLASPQSTTGTSILASPQSSTSSTSNFQRSFHCPPLLQ